MLLLMGSVLADVLFAKRAHISFVSSVVPNAALGRDDAHDAMPFAGEVMLLTVYLQFHKMVRLLSCEYTSYTNTEVVRRALHVSSLSDFAKSLSVNTSQCMLYCELG